MYNKLIGIFCIEINSLVIKSSAKAINKEKYEDTELIKQGMFNNNNRILILHS